MRLFGCSGGEFYDKGLNIWEVSESGVAFSAFFDFIKIFGADIAEREILVFFILIQLNAFLRDEALELIDGFEHMWGKFLDQS